MMEKYKILGIMVAGILSMSSLYGTELEENQDHKVGRLEISRTSSEGMQVEGLEHNMPMIPSLAEPFDKESYPQQRVNINSLGNNEEA